MFWNWVAVTEDIVRFRVTRDNIKHDWVSGIQDCHKWEAQLVRFSELVECHK